MWNIISAFKEFRQEVRLEVNTKKSEIWCVKFKQRKTGKVLTEQLGANNLAKPAVSGEWRGTGGGRLGKLLSEQKEAGIDAKSESNSGCTWLWVASRAFGTSVGRTWWNHMEWAPGLSCSGGRGIQGEDVGVMPFPPRLWLLGPQRPGSDMCLMSSDARWRLMGVSHPWVPLTAEAGSAWQFPLVSCLRPSPPVPTLRRSFI